MTTIYTDLNVRIYKNNEGNIKNLFIKYQNQAILNQYSDNQFIKHYQNIIKKLDAELDKIHEVNKDKKINGNFCKLFI